MRLDRDRHGGVCRDEIQPVSLARSHPDSTIGIHWPLAGTQQLICWKPLAAGWKPRAHLLEANGCSVEANGRSLEANGRWLETSGRSLEANNSSGGSRWPFIGSRWPLVGTQQVKIGAPLRRGLETARLRKEKGW